MRVLSLLIFAFLLQTIPNSLQAQKVKDIEGSFEALKGQKKVNVFYVYDNMGVGDFEKEADYVNKKIKEKNEDEPGTGEEWARKWVDDREARFEPKFEELMTEYLQEHGMVTGRYPNAEYTLIVETTFTEPGFNVGVMRRPAFINLEIKLAKTSDMKKIVGKCTIKKIPGRDAMGFDFDTGYRLQEAYAKGGKTFAKYLDNKVL
ncbi:MAG: hypothetical protein R2879_11230 [Saprospiraceae bacterium]